MKNWGCSGWFLFIMAILVGVTWASFLVALAIGVHK